MGIDSDVQHLSGGAALEILDTDEFYLGRVTEGKSYYLTGAVLRSSLGIVSPDIVTCPANDTTQIIIGAVIEFNACTIDLSFTRGVTRCRQQIIQIMQLNGTPLLNEMPYVTLPNDAEETNGITLDVILDTGNIILTVTVDNSDAEDVILNYAYLNKR